MNSAMELHVFHRSYFCGKMMAYMRYKELPHRVVHSTWADIGNQMLHETGLMGFPVIKLPDGRYLSDTTPMMLWLETGYPKHSILSEDPVTNFFIRLLEDYADEWLWRPAILSRWQNKVDRIYYQKLFAEEVRGSRGLTAKLVERMIPWHMRMNFLEGDGVTNCNREHVWSIYTDTLARLEAIFQEQDYLLGDKPSMADFGFFGSMFWHFSSDPTPSRIMHETAPAVNEWVARMWNAKGTKLSCSDFNITPGAIPPLWDPLIEDVCQSYLPYLRANSEAFAKDKKRLKFKTDGYEYPNMRTSVYRVRCLEVLQGLLASLSEREQLLVKKAMPNHAMEILTNRSEKPSLYDPENLAPFANPGKVSTLRKLSFFLGGSTPHIRYRAWDNRA